MQDASTLTSREGSAMHGERAAAAELPVSAGATLRFHETILHGAWFIEPTPAWDHRGFFMRTFCAREFTERGLVATFVQHSISSSRTIGTLRGMHFQHPPHQEVKVVTCLKGAIWDVLIDLRQDSPTFAKWQGFELTAMNRRRLYIPQGFAHGHQSLSDDTEVGYLISEYYVPDAADGVRHDDPAFAIEWPLRVTAISHKDRTWPDFALPIGL
jgi:dTDP-4-dehydrorhamnose 3,5-epimerase